MPIDAIGSDGLIRRIPQWLALGAIGGPVLLVFAWVVLGLLRPDYAPMRQQISDLGVGANALPMNAAFVFSGLLLLGGVIGIFQSTWRDVGKKARWMCMALLALSPLGLVIVGLFTEAPSTWIGHAVGAVLVFQTPVAGLLVAGFVFWRRQRWRRIGRWLLLASPLTLVLVYSLFQAVLPDAAPHMAQLGGLIERVVSTGARTSRRAWTLAVCAALHRSGLPALLRQSDRLSIQVMSARCSRLQRHPAGPALALPLCVPAHPQAGLACQFLPGCPSDRRLPSGL